MPELLDRVQWAVATRYDIVREAGRGAMAHVYLARDRIRGEDVALKVLRPQLALALGTARFLREIRLLGALDHPHILPLLDSGEFGRLLYYTTSFARGGTLRDRISKGARLPIDEVIRIAADVGGALDYAHERGIIHRDIKPENILFDGERALVCDFGIARAVETAGGDELSSSGLLIGTPVYMSPEQTMNGAQLDGRSDLYALGCVVYEMLAGHPPFEGATPQVVFARHRLESAPPLRVVRPEVPEHVEDAVRWMLAKAPADRPGVARDFIERLRRG